MSPLRRSRRRALVAAGALALAAGAPAAPAAAQATLSLQDGILTYRDGGDAEDLLVHPLLVNGVGYLDVKSSAYVVRDASAATICPADGTSVRCAAATVAGVAIDAGPQDDVVHVAPVPVGMASFPVVVVAGAGDDRLAGGSGEDRLDGGPGDDTIVGWGGVDEVVGGDGDDDLRMRDGTVDRVDCGPGDDDWLQRDAGDVHAGCESFTPDDVPLHQLPPRAPAPPAARAPTPPPAQRRGDAPPAQPARPPSIEARIVRGRDGGRVARLAVRRLPAEATVALRCRAPRAGGCPFARVTRSRRRAVDRLDLSGRLRGRVLPAGTVLVVRVAAPGGVRAERRIVVRGA